MANLDGACITREQFLLREMRVVCQLWLDGLSNGEIVERVKDGNLIQYPTERMVDNITRVCCKRIDAVGSDRIVRAIARAMPDASAQANLYAMMCTYPLVRDFMANEVGRRFSELDYHLGKVEMGAYITRLQTDYDNMAKIADSTIGKIKQVLRKCLIECGMLESARSETLIAPFLDLDVRSAIEAKGDYQALAAFGVQGAM